MSELIVPIGRVSLNSKQDLKFAQPASNASLEEQITILLTRDLARLGWRLQNHTSNSFHFSPPSNYDKAVIKKAMAFNRSEVLQRNRNWIEKYLPMAQANLATGKDVLKSPIIPRIEVCNTAKQRNLFRIYRYFWSSPYSEYVGRRIRLLIRDDGVAGSPVIGIAALGSSIIHIPDRDNWIGWAVKTRTKQLIYVMDAYILGALPPYNQLLGGKLIAYILASNEIRELFKQKYAHQKTIIEGRVANDLALIVTSSLYGKHSSQYNRIKYKEDILYQPIGTTLGYGTLHISNETFEAMRELVELNNKTISYKFGSGPNWRMRIIDTACRIMQLDSDVILKHSFQRGLYALPLAHNWQQFLLDNTDILDYKDFPLKDLITFWKERWLSHRLDNPSITDEVQVFLPEHFNLF